MKINIKILVCFSLIWSCKSIDSEPKIICENVVLNKVDWSYCNPITLKKCGNGLDTLQTKTIREFNEDYGTIEADGLSFCIVPSTKAKITPYNLPECFKKNGLKIKFSGIEKISIIDYSCGNPFELTKIETQ